MSTTFYYSVVITTVIIILLVTFYILYRFYRFLFLRNALIGNTLPLRLINLAATCLIFPTFFYVLFSGPFKFLFTILYSLGSNIEQVVNTKTTTVSYYHVAPFFSSVYNAANYYFTESVFTFHFFLAIVFSVILNIFINTLFYDPERKGYFFALKLAPLVSQGIALFFLIGGSMFLVVCAMIALSYNGTSNEVSNQNDSLEIVVKRLEPTTLKVLPDTGTWYTSFAVPKELNEKRIEEIIKKDSSDIRKYIDYQYSQLKKNIDMYNTAVSDYNKYVDEKVKNMRERFKDRSDLTKKLRDNYEERILSWFNEEQRSSNNVYSTYESVLRDFVRNIQDRQIEISDRFTEVKNNLKKSDSVVVAMRQYSVDPFAIYLSSDVVQPLTISKLNNLEDLPPEPTLGTDWGYLGLSASWLIKAQSMDLVLIVGMLGFGLLGAAISSFVKTDDGSTVKIKNLSVVIIRGFAAAIVIFLATKGGIAVINSGANEPNPWVLFFTCLLGAVFSERIWDWARIQISSRFPEDDDSKTNGKDAATAGSLAAAAAVEVANAGGSGTSGADAGSNGDTTTINSNEDTEKQIPIGGKITPLP